MKAKWAADDEAARQAERDARLRQQQLNAEVKEFNRYACKQVLSACDTRTASIVNLVMRLIGAHAEDVAHSEG